MYFMKYWNRKIYFQGLIGVVIFFCFLFLSPLPENFQVLCLAGTGTGAFMILRALACRISRFPLPRIKTAITKTAGISYEIFLLHHFVLIHLLRIFFVNRILTQGMGILLFAGWCLLIGITAWILHRFLSSLSKSFLTN